MRSRGLLRAAFVSVAAISATLAGLASAHAQAVSISTDRPGFSSGTSIVRPGGVQLEFGSRVERSLEFEETSLSPFEALGRVGLGEHVEWRLGTTPVAASWFAESSDVRFGSATLGAKIAGPVGDSFEIGVLPFVSAADEIEAEQLSGGAVALASLGGLGPVSLTANAGLANVPGAVDREWELSGSVSAGVGLSEALDLYVETYSTGFLGASTELIGVSVEGGATYLFAPRFQGDLYVGSRVVNGARLYGGAGVSFLF